jgi:hypothetical protein
MKTYLPKPKDWPDALYKLCTTDAKTRRAKYSVGAEVTIKEQKETKQ